MNIDLASRQLIMLPGIYDSGPNHWQTRWQQVDPQITRFEPGDWDQPRLDDWLPALSRAVSATAPDSPVLIAHSLACLLVPIWAATAALPVAGAVLVAPIDPDQPAYPDEAAEFRDFPRRPLPFPTLVVSSLDDHYATTDWSSHFAQDLGARVVVAGALGHINADSGLADWQQGRDLVTAFCAGLAPPWSLGR